MEQDLHEIVSILKEQNAKVLLLLNLAESGIENDIIEKTWDLYLFFDILKNYCLKIQIDFQKFHI